MTETPLCEADGCQKPQWRTTNYCCAHYCRLLRWGDPFGGSTGRGEAARFVETAISYEGDDCLKWPYACGSNGYGQVWYHGQRYIVARLICKLTQGDPPTDEHVAAHLCGRGHEGCCNPRHLKWKTPKENEADKLAHNTINHGERCGTAKLTDQEARLIRAATDLTSDKLAAEFGVSRGTINNIRSRRTFRHLD